MRSQAPPLGAQTLQLLLQQNSPSPQVLFPHGSPAGTFAQAHTDGEPSQMRSDGQAPAGCLQTHTPMQSAPPALGSQLSVGSSWQLPLPGHGLPLNPPQLT